MRFHWSSSIYFERQGDGSVKVSRVSGMETANVRGKEFEFTIPASEWASIVAAVSQRGETAETYASAFSFHSRRADTQANEPAGAAA